MCTHNEHLTADTITLEGSYCKINSTVNAQHISSPVKATGNHQLNVSIDPTFTYAGCPNKVDTNFKMNATLKLIKINGFRIDSFVRLPHLCLRLYPCHSSNTNGITYYIYLDVFDTGTNVTHTHTHRHLYYIYIYIFLLYIHAGLTYKSCPILAIRGRIAVSRVAFCVLRAKCKNGSAQ